VFDRELTQDAVLGRGQDAAGRLHAQHEVADLWLVLGQPVPLETDHVLFRNVEVVLLRQLVDLVLDLERELVALQTLDVVALKHHVPVGSGAGSWSWSWSWSWS